MKTSGAWATIIMLVLGGGGYKAYDGIQSKLPTKDAVSAIKERQAKLDDQIEALAKVVETKETIKRMDDLIKWDKENVEQLRRERKEANELLQAQITRIDAHFEKIDEKIEDIRDRIPRKKAIATEQFPVLVKVGI